MQRVAFCAVAADCSSFILFCGWNLAFYFAIYSFQFLEQFNRFDYLSRTDCSISYRMYFVGLVHCPFVLSYTFSDMCIYVVCVCVQRASR